MIPKRTDDTRTRRSFLRAAGGLAVAGLLAGCTDGGSASGSGGGSGATSLDDWLSGTDNYDSVRDLTGRDSVVVEVGPGGDEFVFGPAAIRVDPGTTVVWKWIGSGHHNVVATEGEFDSGRPEEGAAFEHTFETPGTALYYCDPHRNMGMKGAVVVAGSDGESTAEAAGLAASR